MSEMQKTEQIILEALARGYTYVANEQKELDATLIEAMAEELMIVFDKELPHTITLKFESFQKGHTTISELLDVLLVKK